MARTKRSRAGRPRKVNIKRVPSGRISRHAYEKVGPTPELEKRREILLGDRNAPGETDVVLDHLASSIAQIITQKQAEAGRLYATQRLRALRAVGVSPDAKSPKLAERIGGSPRVPTVEDDGKAAYYWRRARQCVFDAGTDVRKVVDLVCVDNGMPRGHQIGKLRIGLNALVSHYRL